MTSVIGIGCIGMTLACLILGSCDWHVDGVDMTVERVDQRPRRVMGLPAPPDCGHLYNNGNHKEWATCMGVQYK